MITKPLRNSLLTGVSVAAMAMGSSMATAQDTPTTAELYEMLLKQQAQINAISDRANRAENELAKAKADLAKARAAAKGTEIDLASTRSEMAETHAKLATLEEQAQIAAAQQDQATLGTAPSQSVLRIPNNPGKAFAYADWLYLQPVVNDLQYAGLNGSSNTPTGTFALVSVDPDYESGYRVGGGYLFPGTGIAAWAQYTSLDTSASDSVTGEFVHSIHQKANSNLAGTAATATYDLDYEVIDVALTQHIQAGSKVDLKVTGGLRIVEIDQSLSTVFTGDPDFDVPGTITTKHDFDGAGPLLAAAGTWDVGYGFSVFGGGGAALLVGDGQSRFTQAPTDSDPFTGPDLLINDNPDQIVTNLSSHVGVGYAMPVGNGMELGVKFGYELDYYLNAFQENLLPDDTSDDFVSHEETDFGVHGFFLRGVVKAQMSEDMYIK